MGVGGQCHAPASLSLGETRYPLYRRLGGPQGKSGRVWKIPPPTGIRSPDRPACGESLYRLSYPGALLEDSSVFILRGKQILKLLFYECLTVTLRRSVTVNQWLRTLLSLQTWISRQWGTQEFCAGGGGGFQQIQLRTEDIEKGIWGR